MATERFAPKIYGVLRLAQQTAMTFCTKLFEKLEQEVPVFTEAFLCKRNYIMWESILRERRNEDIATIIGVVGLAQGMSKQNRC